ncbi:MAG TPA: hypothetical protein VGP94_01355, partial [Tepidisphaeraceae bacterium]|nr:hypothetical protein [Tepidisphaeraceae bacterium]
FADQFKRAGVQPDVIIADWRLTGGNVRLQFPRAVVRVPEVKLSPPPEAGEWLVVWEEERRRPTEFVKKLRPLADCNPQRIEAPLKYMTRPAMELHYCVVR